MRGLAARFVVPAEARSVWLVSATSRPCDVGKGDDGRDLGLCLAALTLDDGFGVPRAIALDDPLLCVGLHPLEIVEGRPLRWTQAARGCPPRWDGCPAAVFLRVDLVGPAVPR